MVVESYPHSCTSVVCFMGKGILDENGYPIVAVTSNVGRKRAYTKRKSPASLRLGCRGNSTLNGLSPVIVT